MPMYPGTVIVSDGEGEGRKTRIEFTAPPEPPPPPVRASSEVAYQLKLQTQLVEQMEGDVIPRAIRCRDQLREAFGEVQAELDRRQAHIAALRRQEREAAVKEGQVPQFAHVLPPPPSAGLPAYGYTASEKASWEVETLIERQWKPANQLWLNQEHHLGGLQARLNRERQKKAELEGELANSRAREGQPPLDPERPGGPIAKLQAQLAQLGVGPHPRERQR